MSDVAIRAEGVGKRYAVAAPGARDPHYTALRDVLAREARAMLRRTRDLLRGRPLLAGEAPEPFWALQDVSFTVRPGERLGIIGRNGAGKSTLLKVLSRITEPTTGRVELAGRVASLLEVGTGFHPELTGRENIFLNGAVLGMTRREIRRRFDEIVDFAEVERFLDTPVKRYSSGMYMRLAFAVAAHLEPEILVVDEVLAVGDAAFQRKCLGKMEAAGRDGRTVLFVSHNMGAVAGLCDRALLIDGGRVLLDGSPADCIARYVEGVPASPSEVTARDTDPAGRTLVLERVAIRTSSDATRAALDNGTPAYLEVTFWVERPGTSYAIAAEIESAASGVLFASSTLDGRPAEELGTFASRGRYVARLALPTEWLRGGAYRVRVAATVPNVIILDRFAEELTFTIDDTASPMTVLGEARRGVIVPRLPWTVRQVDG
jgi:lipopolysaccharide transport system ATP-binding protein